MESGSVVVIAHRDAGGSPSTASLSGTATLIELARDLEGETLHRTVVLASTSGSQGTAGAIRLAQKLGGPIDAVIVLGDLASAHLHQPIIVPWSEGQQVAPPRLRNTVAAALNQQAGITSGGTSLFGQFAHLAFPLTLTEQGPFGARGIPAVLLSLSGERGPAPKAPISSASQLTSVGQAMLSAVSALNSGPTVAAATPYVLFDNKVVPGWAISVFVLALVVPVLLTTIDGIARALRRGYRVSRWVLAVLLAAVPFVLGTLVILGARALGTLAIAPPGPVAAGLVPIHGSGTVVMLLAAVVAIGSAIVLAPFVVRFAAGSRRSRDVETLGRGRRLRGPARDVRGDDRDLVAQPVCRRAVRARAPSVAAGAERRRPHAARGPRPADARRAGAGRRRRPLLRGDARLRARGRSLGRRAPDRRTRRHAARSAPVDGFPRLRADGVRRRSSCSRGSRAPRRCRSPSEARSRTPAPAPSGARSRPYVAEARWMPYSVLTSSGMRAPRRRACDGC